MATIRRFEEIEAWQKARALMNFIYERTENCTDFRFRNQIRDAAVSSMSNIAEGFEGLTNKQFVRYLGIAKASAGEVRSHLYVALDRGYIDRDGFNQGYRLSTETAQMIWKLIVYLKQNSTRQVSPRNGRISKTVHGQKR